MDPMTRYDAPPPMAISYWLRSLSVASFRQKNNGAFAKHFWSNSMVILAFDRSTCNKTTPLENSKRATGHLSLPPSRPRAFGPDVFQRSCAVALQSPSLSRLLFGFNLPQGGSNGKFLVKEPGLRVQQRSLEKPLFANSVSLNQF